jgi:hypothetical protein|tara:strand:- start:136 stop:354 length:219 start_codon:yes stop_codon:yes gene_type:complete
MRAGDLVGITRASIGVPAGTLGLIIAENPVSPDPSYRSDRTIYVVQLVGNKAVHAAVGRERRYLARDLEIVK